MTATDPPTERSLDLAAVALESAAQACQSGASLRQERGLDPLAREYLVAARELEALRVTTYGGA